MYLQKDCPIASVFFVEFICGLSIDVDLRLFTGWSNNDSGVAQDTNNAASAPAHLSKISEHHSTARSLLSLDESTPLEEEQTSSNEAPLWPAHPAYTQCRDFYHSQPYRWATYEPRDPLLQAARAKLRRPTDEELDNTAIVTMATGDNAARGAVALMQSLRDVGTRVPRLIVLLFRGGHGSSWCDNYQRKQARLGSMNWPCGRQDGVAEDVVSPEYLEVRFVVKENSVSREALRVYAHFMCPPAPVPLLSRVNACSCSPDVSRACMPLFF